MTAPCPSDLALEAHLLDPAASALGAHLDACAACAARLAAMERQGEDFRRFVYPATVGKVEEAAGGRRRRALWMLLPAPLLAAALAVVVLRPSAGPDEDYLGPKGTPGGLGLTVFTPGEGGARPLAEGAHLPATAAVRFRVRNAAPCRLVVFSVDAAGQVSRLAAPAAELPAGTHDLEGGAVLDGKPGPERFYGVCAGGLGFDALEPLARAAAGGGPDALRRAGALGGPAAELAQASVLVEKDGP